MTSLLDLAEPRRLTDHALAPSRAPAAPAPPMPSRRAALRLLAVAVAAPAAAVAVSRPGAPEERSEAPLPAVDPGRALAVTAGAVTLRPGPPAAEHAGHAAPDVLGHRTWTSTVRADLAVENSAGQPVPFSPGQVRLRLPDGTTVQPAAWQDAPAVVAPRSTTRLWVEYRTPGPGVPVALDYTPAGHTEPVRLLDATLPATVPATSGARR